MAFSISRTYSATMETKPLSITGAMYIMMVIIDLLPSKAGQFPISTNNIHIQGDKASSHNCQTDIVNVAFRNHAMCMMMASTAKQPTTQSVRC